MAEVKTTIQIIDDFSAPLTKLLESIEKVTASFDKLSTSLAKPLNSAQINTATSATSKLSTAAEKASSTANSMSSSVSKAGSSASAMGAKTNSAASKQSKMNSEMSKGEIIANRLNQTFKHLLATYGGWMAVTGIIKASDELTNMRGRMALVTGSMEEADVLMDKVYRAAQRSNTAFGATGSLVARFGMNARDAFNNVDEMVAVAETLNKKFILAGTTQEEAASAMIQLSQAMGSGLLRGEELAAVFEAAPNAIQDIADYLDVPIGKIRTLAEEGMLTSDIVKNALLKGIAETNRKFAEMPPTFERSWTVFKNAAIKSFDAVSRQFATFLSDPRFIQFVSTLGLVVTGVIKVFGVLMGVVGKVFGFIADNASFTLPIIFGLSGAWAAYTIAIHANSLAKVWNMALTVATVAKNFILMASVYGLAGAFRYLNIIMSLNPVGVIIMAVTALITLFYLAVAAVNHFTGANVSATGIIFGAFALLFSFINNQIVYLANVLISFAEFLVNVFADPIGAIEGLVLNLQIEFINACISMTKGWDSFATSMANAFISAINAVLGAWNKLIDLLPADVASTLGLGKATEIKAVSSVTGGLTAARDAVQKRKDAVTKNHITFGRLNYADVGGLTTKAYNTGADLVGSFAGVKDITKGLAGKGFDSLADQYGKSMTALDVPEVDDATKKKMDGILNKGDKTAKKNAAHNKKTADNTAKMAEDTSLIELMRDIGEREAVNRFTTAQIKVQQSNQNHFSRDVDGESFINGLAKLIENAMVTASEKVHY